ncbi:tetratricopeptide repeat-containing sensor histidine kinase [Xanthocytophaga flava]|uniref:tetratricopeptide repeat-containing sensor histidine kinase n=1 Tax=Xanthocytophaga flava TaxID=3048013 RepID=UPI0028D8A270|nr:tetratricopeptide repeat protein [Xanthocytophaga flavus]MDJ1472203.1 tetratricopeptide repeat protein [Xanthocytophaga flavus]
MHKIIVWLLVLGVPSLLVGQSVKTDSLHIAVLGATNPVQKADALNNLADAYRFKNTDSTISIGTQALLLAKRNDYAKGEIIGLYNVGNGYLSQGDYHRTLSYLLRALRIAEEHANDSVQPMILNSVGTVYMKSEKLDQAMYYYEKAKQLAEIQKDKFLLAKILGNIGNIYWAQKKIMESLHYKQKSLTISRENNDLIGVATELYNIGLIYLQQNRHDYALTFYKESYNLSERLEDKEGLAFCSFDMGEVYLHQKDYKAAITYIHKGLDQAKKLKSKNLIYRGYDLLFQLYEKQKDYVNALSYHKLATAIKDSIFSLERERALKEVQTDYDLNKKQKEIDLLYKDKTMQDAQLHSQSIQQNILIFGLTLIAVVALLFWINMQSRKKINMLLEQENELVRLQKEEIFNQTQEIADQNQKLEALNVTKDKLFSIISHDLRSPLNTLQSMLEIVRDGILSEEETVEITGLLYKKVRHTSDLLDNLLNWAKSQMEGIRIHQENVNLQELIQSNVDLFLPQALEKKIVMENNVLMPVYVNADKNMLLLVIRNLLNNAIKFTTAQGCVRISAEIQSEKVVVCVQDTGVGIDPDRIDKLFKVQSLFTTYGTSNEKGTGLGLLLCKDFVEKNGGDIWVKSSINQGSRFYFSVPLYVQLREISSFTLAS